MILLAGFAAGGFHSLPATGRWKKTINKTGYDIAPLQAKCLPAEALSALTKFYEGAQAGVREKIKQED
ncbi:MAG TPA: hypothetical protein VGK25_09625 [Ignavibacteria bacterium]